LFRTCAWTISLEIGFGGGEHLLHRAREAPDTGFIGVEPFVNSMAKLLAAAGCEGLSNIRLYDDDATQVARLAARCLS
jgi:tRNA (guanine-N7-)-methyltransferase